MAGAEPLSEDELLFFRGERSTLKVCCCVFCTNRNVRAASSGDNLQIAWQAWHVVICDDTLHFILRTPQSTLHIPHFTLYTPHFTLHTLHSTLFNPHSILHTLHSTLCTLYSTLHMPDFTLYTLHSTPYTLYSTLQTRSLEGWGRLLLIWVVVLL